jgi:hypothetical protein
MWDPQPLTTLRASKACRGENFTFTLFEVFMRTLQVVSEELMWMGRNVRTLEIVSEHLETKRICVSYANIRIA